MMLKEILDNVLVEVSVTLIIGVLSVIFAFFKGRKKGESISVKAVERKKELYQPLLDGLEPYAYSEWGILESIKVNILNECVINSYKYSLNEELLKKLEMLHELHYKFNGIKVSNIAHNVVCKIFETGYKELYGSIVDGVIKREIVDGEYTDEEIIAEPVQSIKCLFNENDYKKLIENEGCPDGIVYINIPNSEEGSYPEEIYNILKNIYATALNTWVNGKKYELPECRIKLDMAPEEYFAYKYDFFLMFNEEEQIKKKYEIKEEITLLSQSIIQDLKEIIEKIVKVYEVERI